MIDKKRLKFEEYNGIKAFYIPRLNGGATSFGHDFVPIVKSMFGRVGTICEFCSGPGLIGFSLLANELCDRLCLVDINPEAIELCRYTIEQNGLEGKVDAFVSDGLKNVPANQVWDLVISNPPHFDGSEKEYKNDLIAIDPGWRVHREFYADVGAHLNKGGRILFVENSAGSNYAMWEKMIKENGLVPVKEFVYSGPRPKNNILKNGMARLSDSVRDGTLFSKGIRYHANMAARLVKGTYKYDKFYYVLSQKA
ncbi:MAG: class I SAM-dependent methyltransferase [Candidatus Micrarchaeales archaeon]|uniref:Methyltransferase small n=1 Tax=Candidatus Micrarchaeum acidiphilum ARMAN-2 TaxID=425595 RepID=C7DGV2_MICA2|nr:MAG: methyltransferase small [Candidatus Micrarchaeum acidiphilum ARMAN-2]MCW6161499.1 class I SAM-dependent methyltransferase [Candidatus Micrarchaeales archaeon]